MFWYGKQGSNLRPLGPKPSVLPTELLPYVVRMKGLEPPRLSTLAPKASAATITPHPHFCRNEGTRTLTHWGTTSLVSLVYQFQHIPFLKVSQITYNCIG